MFSENSILSYFADMEDPRKAEKVTHPFINSITIAILGVICGWLDGWVDIERLLT